MDDREQHEAVMQAEKADDATAIKVFRAVAMNLRSNGIRMGAAATIDALCDRLEAANGRRDQQAKFADVGVEVNGELMARVHALIAKFAASGNYVADKETDPTCVWFKNGRKVSLRTEVREGRIVRAWLDVERTPPTD